ncbi:MAG: alcohol dehydrogenase catalytic domain-containing protein [Chthoniobacter sp.]
MLTDCDTLPARGGGVLVRVACSSLNYKDALAVAGNQNKVLRHLPIVPGIDLAGIVEDPGGDGRFTAGQPVILTGYGIGEQVSGGTPALPG